MPPSSMHLSEWHFIIIIVTISKAPARASACITVSLVHPLCRTPHPAFCPSTFCCSAAAAGVGMLPQPAHDQQANKGLRLHGADEDLGFMGLMRV